MQQLIADPLSRQEIERFAWIVREIADYTGKLLFPVVHFTELALPQIDPDFNFMVMDIKEMPDKYATYNAYNNTMEVREDVYQKAIEGDGRQRFTIAHELGHYFLHKEGVKLCRTDGNSRVVSYLDPEWQANTFASALLMPPRMIEGLSPLEISLACKTSAQAAEIAYNKVKKPS